MTSYTDPHDLRFGGIGRLFGQTALEHLQRAHVAIIGIGGVGSWTVEALARSGVGQLTLIDLDDVCVSNVNRQLHALDAAVGRPKVEVMADRVRQINPRCQAHAIADFFTPTTADALITPALDLVVDAIDHPRNKALLIAHSRAQGIDLVTVGGAGGRRDPTQIKVDDLNRTSADGLLRAVRKKLRREHDFPRSNARWDIPCVFSSEPLRFPTPDGNACDTRADDTSLRLDCATGFGTASFVTGTFGLVAASVAVERLTRDHLTTAPPSGY